MAVAQAYGIPRSQLLGREPAEITVHEWEDGRPVRSITTREPRWTDEDIAWALAWMQEQADRCPGPCGLPLSETTAMKDGDPVHVYTVPKPKRCHACDALIAAQEEDAEMPSKRQGARMWSVEQS